MLGISDASLCSRDYPASTSTLSPNHQKPPLRSPHHRLHQFSHQLQLGQLVNSTKPNPLSQLFPSNSLRPQQHHGQTQEAQAPQPESHHQNPSGPNCRDRLGRTCPTLHRDDGRPGAESHSYSPAQPLDAVP
ncbi:hypothetical protein BT67DRAFT_262392 [Trichocladium antarcticum]|uniref:Uncharacterized protein n=1 Tax=Trichocladium antarcticum TaxID=1450529 RepID=A0AAN6UML5_9PEZI|nr:hypothetical protein BT67DRAFT_262392 [Trichocladium antarcticum]